MNATDLICKTYAPKTATYPTTVLSSDSVNAFDRLFMSIGGFANDVEIRKYLTAIPERSRENWDALEMQGALLAIGEDGKATSIETIRYPVTETEEEKKEDV